MPLFDAHLHIIDPAFPLIANQGYLPPAYTTGDYLDEVLSLGITGGTVVSGSFQGFDQGYLLAALKALGPQFVGITQLPASTGDAEIQRLADAGVRGLRFNLRRGGSADIAELASLARRVHALAGWHVELYADATDLEELAPLLTRLPAVSIDHLGLSKAGLPILLRLAEAGVRVKACGFGRVDFDVANALQRLQAANPAALMFGSDLPSTRAPRRFHASDIRLIHEALSDAACHAVLHDNATAFYRMPLPGTGKRYDRATS